MPRRVASSSPRPVIAAVIAAVVVVAAGLAVIRPSLVGLGDDEVAQFVLLPLPTAAADVTDETIRETMDLITERARELGVDAPRVSREDGKVLVAINEGDDPDGLIEALTARARFVIFDYEANLVGPGPLDTLTAAIERAGPARGAEGYFYLFDPRDQLLAGPVFGRAALDMLVAERFPTGPLDGSTERSTPANRLVVVQEGKLSPEAELTQSEFHVVRDRPRLDNDDIQRAFVREDSTVARRNVVIDVGIDLTAEGAEQFRLLVRDLAQRGQILGENQTFGVLVDNEMIDRAPIRASVLPAGVGGDRLGLVLDCTLGEAERLVAQLNVGPLPLDLEIVARR
jgi:preprotein translocase subunit SecD